jgi:hypothetical protein
MSGIERLPGLVAELIRLPVAVIVANLHAALAAKAATTTVPIVFATGSDCLACTTITFGYDFRKAQGTANFAFVEPEREYGPAPFGRHSACTSC